MSLNNQVSADKLVIQAWRGEYLMMDKQYADAFHATIFQVPTPVGKGVLVSPTVDGTLIVGPTAERVVDKTDIRTTAAGLQMIKTAASRVWKGFSPSGVIATFAGLRAHGDRGDFVLGEPADAPGFFNAAGIESPGLTAAPALGVWPTRMVTSLVRVQGRQAPLSVKTTRPVPKELIFSCLDAIHKIVAIPPVNIGDVLLKDVAGTGIDIVATSTLRCASQVR